MQPHIEYLLFDEGVISDDLDGVELPLKLGIGGVVAHCNTLVLPQSLEVGDRKV
jgi:hypothetical protein